MLVDALEKEIKVGDEVYYWDMQYGSYEMYVDVVIKVNSKTIRLEDTGNTNHHPYNLLRVKSREVLDRKRHVGDTVIFKQASYACFGEITRISSYDCYVVNNVRRHRFTNSQYNSKIREVAEDQCMKISDGKKSKIKHLKGVQNV